MRVVMDAMSARAGGGQTYLRNLLTQELPPVDLEVLVLAPPNLGLKGLASNVRHVLVNEHVAQPVARAAWERLRLPRLLDRLDADVVFFPGGRIPSRLNEGRVLVTMSRNMLPLDPSQRARYPIGYTRARLCLLGRMLIRSMLAADLVIFVSEHAREVVTERTGGAVRRSVVIPHGVDREFRSGAARPRPAWMPSEDCILYVSNIEPYKAQLELVRAFSLLKERRRGPEKLVLVGPPSCTSYTRQLRREIEAGHLGDQVLVTGEIDHHELPAVYGNACCAVFASMCENCPNGLLEAMASGRALVVSDHPPMPEFAGGAVLYADPQNTEQMAWQLQRLLDDTGLRAELGTRAAQLSGQFDWARTASRTWSAIAEAGRRSRTRDGYAQINDAGVVDG